MRPRPEGLHRIPARRYIDQRNDGNVLAKGVAGAGVVLVSWVDDDQDSLQGGSLPPMLSNSANIDSFLNSLGPNGVSLLPQQDIVATLAHVRKAFASDDGLATGADSTKDGGNKEAGAAGAPAPKEKDENESSNDGGILAQDSDLEPPDGMKEEAGREVYNSPNDESSNNFMPLGGGNLRDGASGSGRDSSIPGLDWMNALDEEGDSSSSEDSDETSSDSQQSSLANAANNNSSAVPRTTQSSRSSSKENERDVLVSNNAETRNSAGGPSGAGTGAARAAPGAGAAGGSSSSSAAAVPSSSSSSSSSDEQVPSSVNPQHQPANNPPPPGVGGGTTAAVVQTSAISASAENLEAPPQKEGEPATASGANGPEQPPQQTLSHNYSDSSLFSMLQQSNRSAFLPSQVSGVSGPGCANFPCQIFTDDSIPELDDIYPYDFEMCKKQSLKKWWPILVKKLIYYTNTASACGNSQNTRASSNKKQCDELLLMLIRHCPEAIREYPETIGNPLFHWLALTSPNSMSLRPHRSLQIAEALIAQGFGPEMARVGLKNLAKKWENTHNVFRSISAEPILPDPAILSRARSWEDAQKLVLDLLAAGTMTVDQQLLLFQMQTCGGGNVNAGVAAETAGGGKHQRQDS